MTLENEPSDIVGRVQAAMLLGWTLKRVIVNRSDYTRLLEAVIKLTPDPVLSAADPAFYGVPVVVSEWVPDGGVLEMDPPTTAAGVAL